MSWSGFKKNVGRATTQVMMKTGHVEKTSDRSYEVEERRYRTLESASLRLQKEAKGYLDSLRAMTASQMRIAETIDAFYGESGAKDGVSRSYKQAVEDLDAETVKALDGPYRCVPLDLYHFAFDEEEGTLDRATIEQIEREMNFVGGKKRRYTRGFDGASEGGVEVEGASMLMDFIYRTTVLEPISRFCAYFPDINECIKKRNHKMLDYDAMRNKVKRLVEKPDKDPGKLPRTEKEAEMVSVTDFLRDAHDLGDPLLDLDPDTMLDLEMPSPPKALDMIKRVQQLQREEEEMVRRHSGLTIRGLCKSPSTISRVSSTGRATRLSVDEMEEGVLQHSPSTMFHASTLRSPSMSFSGLPMLRESSMEAPLQRPSGYGAVSSMASASGSTLTLIPTSHLSPNAHPARMRALGNSPSLASLTKRRRSKDSPMPAAGKPPVHKTRTPFMNPSELEHLMQPLREEYIRTQTNELAQAKAAYDQLNEQLTSELPQLIDLRVPYLDPSFEALVKIQLRFCAEAYSRMAQVQQYLDASTRDQYASGDLDARVEDVLGQIRELSIAGTV
ncbi:hypothetical protein LTR36_009337 [Oleoguttula mirabilis]|uniref:BAR domain-containing protein n=1 Tax=Oleoguttula mirabilis TaxID=1507867 RepID=A0AAV9JS24_9PEZI|nr:hypothetical protein LTR36_009337 [Oleoguttula mirabilis]